MFDAVTKELEVELLDVLSVAVTTCNTFPPPAYAKVLSPLKKVVASLVPDAVSLASETEASFNFAVVTALSLSLAVETVLSDGTPKSKTLPSIIIKSITSPVLRLDAKVIVLPDTVKLSTGDWIIPFKETIM